MRVVEPIPYRIRVLDLPIPPKVDQTDSVALQRPEIRRTFRISWHMTSEITGAPRMEHMGPCPSTSYIPGSPNSRPHCWPTYPSLEATLQMAQDMSTAPCFAVHRLHEKFPISQQQHQALPCHRVKNYVPEGYQYNLQARLFYSTITHWGDNGGTLVPRNQETSKPLGIAALSHSEIILTGHRHTVPL